MNKLMPDDASRKPEAQQYGRPVTPAGPRTVKPQRSKPK
jgi:hypothetical protein